jgi:glycosyltransferase involved in cell wall biosynthesis
MKILFLTVYNISFAERDLKILQSKFVVTTFNFENKSILNLIELIKSNDLIYFWFASIRFFIPVVIAKILKKKIIIVAGGYDVAKVHAIRYGSLTSLWKSIIVKTMLRLSDRVLSVSNSNKNEIINNCKINPLKINMIYHGFETPNRVNFYNKSNIIITTASGNQSVFYRKGIDRFLVLAAHLKEFQFHLIGKIDLDFHFSIPNNVTLNGYTEKDKMISIYEAAKIYIQFSRHEGFGCSVAEAMQYGCIPVVSNCYALPEVIGNCGLVINDFSDYKQIASHINSLFENYDQNLSIKCIERIEKEFSYKTRSNKIITEINNLIR